MAAVPKPLHGRNFVFDGDPGLLFDGKQMLFVLRRPVHSAAARNAVSRKGQASAGRLPAGNTRVYLKRIEKLPEPVCSVQTIQAVLFFNDCACLFSKRNTDITSNIEKA